MSMKPDMNDISLLQKTLKNYFSWHGARIKFLALFIMAIFRIKSINQCLSKNIDIKLKVFFAMV